jgi:hypothetical protein
MDDALLDQHTLTTEGTTAVDEEMLATANGELQEMRDTLAEARTTLVQRETSLVPTYTQL